MFRRPLKNNASCDNDICTAQQKFSMDFIIVLNALRICNDLFEVCIVLFRLNVPVNNFSVMSGRSHRFLGITSTFWGVNVSCSRIQHGDLSDIYLK